MQHIFWYEAMEEEIRATKMIETQELVELPKDKVVVEVKWMYIKKYNSDGTIKRHKVRLITKGHAQVYRTNYEETFVPFT